MNKNLFNAILFTAGAAIGSLVTWKVVKTRYEQILQEEIASFKESYTRCMRGNSDTDNTRNAVKDEPADEDDDEEYVYDYDETEIIDYHKLANRYNKADDNVENSEEGEGDDEVPYVNGPYVIVPEDFADGNYDHECSCLTYYSDGVLADDWYEVFDIEETIGLESLKHFGDYAEDIVHVRNERLCADYEITRDPRKYADIVVTIP